MSDIERERFLGEEAKREMLVGRFEAVVNISKRFVGNPKGAVLAALVAKYYFSRNRVPVHVLSSPDAPAIGAASDPGTGLKTPWGIKLIRRPPLNNRNESQSRRRYKGSMLTEGYNPEARAPPVMKKAKAMELWCLPEWGVCVWSLASATCGEGWYEAKSEAPTRDCVCVTEHAGIPAIMVHEDATDEVDIYVINEQNRWQDGSSFNVQQYLHENDSLAKSWTDEQRTKEWTKSTWGSGVNSHDSQCWSFITENWDKSSRHCDTITEFLHTRTFLEQLRNQGVYDMLMSTLAEDVEHKNANLNYNRFAGIAYSIDSALRTNLVGDSSLPAQRKSTLLHLSLKFALPCVDDPHTTFVLFEQGSASKFKRLACLNVAFKPRAVAALIPAESDKKIKIIKKPRGTRKKETSETPAAAAAAVDTVDTSAPQVPDPETQLLNIFTACSKAIDEGLWQLYAHGVDVNNDADCAVRITELLGVALRLLICGKPQKVLPSAPF